MGGKIDQCIDCSFIDPETDSDYILVNTSNSKKDQAVEVDSKFEVNDLKLCEKPTSITNKNVMNLQLALKHRQQHGIKINSIGKFGQKDCKCNTQIVEDDDEECVCSFVHMCNCGKIFTDTFGDPIECTCDNSEFIWFDGKSRCNIHFFCI